MSRETSVRVLVVEDNARIAGLVRRILAENGYSVTVAATAPDGLLAFETDVYDLVILDLMLPGMPGGGMEVCRRIRTLNSDIPLLMLTALNSMRNRVEGLDAGADDYLVKPFHVDELLARVRALLRRSPSAAQPTLTAQGLTLFPATQSATRAGRTIDLSAKEFAVLDYLMRNTGRIVSSSQLIDHAWDSNFEGFSNVVQSYIRHLRKKLVVSGETDIIETRRGAGYMIAADS